MIAPSSFTADEGEIQSDIKMSFAAKNGLNHSEYTQITGLLMNCRSLGLTRGLCRTELLEVTVCSPSCIMAISPLSSEPSARLLTELLWELALIDMEGSE